MSYYYTSWNNKKG